MDKIKILMVAGSMNIGGIENQLMHLARNVDKNKFQIDFTSTMPNAFYKDEIELLGGRFILIPKMDWGNPLNYCKAMYQVMKKGKYDIVHSHELFHSGITLLLAVLTGIPCRFAHAHNWCDHDGTGRKTSIIRKVYNILMRVLINRCSTVQIACSTWAGKFVYGEKAQNKESYHLVFNSVDTKRFLENYGQIESGEFCEIDGWKNIINVARISAVKNQIFLVDIAEELCKRKKKIRILCVGNGNENDIASIEREIKQRKLNDYIQLLGVRKDIDVLMRKSSAFVLPSKYEGMPLVMIEAQTSGLPCVSSDTYSPEVDFGIKTIKWLSLEAGVKIWTDALVEAVQKPRVPKEKIEKAVKEKKFDSTMFTQILCDLYQEDYIRRGKMYD